MRTSRLFTRIITGAALAVTAIVGVSCATQFTPQYRIAGLRVLGVKVDPEAYGKPGESRKLSMLMYDGAPGSIVPDPTSPTKTKRRAVQVLWIGGCHDPDGDLYTGCFPIISQKLAKLSELASGATPSADDLEALSDIQLGYVGTPTGNAPPAFPPGANATTFTQKIPDDIISRRPASENNTPYGLSYVFFLVCGGTLGPAEASTATNGLPLGCFDATGKQLDATDYLVGYTPIYSYDDVVDNNPIMTVGTFNDAKAITTRCLTDADCPASTVCGEIKVCIPVVEHCSAKKLADCPEITFTPDISQKSQEQDVVAQSDPGGSGLQEIIWVNYYTTDGALTEEVRLVNDAQKGWNPDYGTKWIAPNAPAGEVRLWAVAHDNRGGTAWISQDVLVK